MGNQSTKCSSNFQNFAVSPQRPFRADLTLTSQVLNQPCSRGQIFHIIRLMIAKEGAHHYHLWHVIRTRALPY